MYVNHSGMMKLKRLGRHKRESVECRWLKKTKRHESNKAVNEYQNAWAVYVKQQRMTRQMIMKAKVKCERSVV